MEETFGVEETSSNWYEAAVKELRFEKEEAVLVIAGSWKQAPEVKAPFATSGGAEFWR